MSRQSLIFSRGVNNGILSDADIMQRAPAVFAEDKAERLTSRYAALKTSDLLPVLRDYGYHPVQAAQKRARKGKHEHSAHLLAFSRAGDISSDVPGGGVRSEVLVYNSHNGTSGVKLMAGAYRFVCSNGIVRGDGNSVSIRHTHKAMQDFEAMLRNIIEGVPAMMSTIDALRDRRMSNEEAWNFAEKAVALRWDFMQKAYVPDNPHGSYADSITIRQALAHHRAEDNFSDAWSVFNRVQENVLRGNVFIKSITDKGIRERKARPLASIQEHVSVNQKMFDLVTA
jgi:hypothetical protein